MRRGRYYIGLILFLLIMAVICIPNRAEVKTVKAGYTEPTIPAGWNQAVASYVNQTGIKLSIDGKDVDASMLYMDDTRQIMLPVELLRSQMRCSIGLYDNVRFEAQRNTRFLQASLASDLILVDDRELMMSGALAEVDGEIYISAKAIQEGLAYQYQWNQDTHLLSLTNASPDMPALPTAYDYRTKGRATEVRDQGSLGTCWAFSAITALETALLPEDNLQFSVDHMSLQNSYGRSQSYGGDYIMAMSYLLAWKGPVLEEDDPYGDGQTTPGLKPVKHVSEVQILPMKDLGKIKEAVYLYGGVQTSLYASLETFEGASGYYNEETDAYCYIGPDRVNHDVVIIGWDDAYPKANFSMQPEGDGAFLCANSWGEGFGDDGYFWVSYYDSNIGIYNIVYTGITEPDVYDNIYQTDLCGWVGQLGYDKEDAYFANVYTAETEETLEAVGFYTTGTDTEYEVYVVENFKDTSSLTFDHKVASGTISNSGYYTIPINETIKLSSGARYAVIVYIRTPGATKPIAVEFSSSEMNLFVDITDGEGYISSKGIAWQSAETAKKCNPCLKAYTKNR